MHIPAAQCASLWGGYRESGGPLVQPCSKCPQTCELWTRLNFEAP